MKTLTKRRTEFLREIAREMDFNNLRWEDPAGGHNAYRIPGWAKSPSADWAVAAREAGIPEMQWWEGEYPTPATAFPEAIVQMMAIWDLAEGIQRQVFVELPGGKRDCYITPGA